MPARGSGTIDAGRESVGKERIITQSVHDGTPLIDKLDPTSEDPVDRWTQDQMELERFMNEELTVVIQEPPEGTGEEWVVRCDCGPGQSKHVLRGNFEQPLKRKYVEILCRARRASVRASGYRQNDGEAVNSFSRSTRALKYPFMVVSDPSGAKGQKWLLTQLNAEY